MNPSSRNTMASTPQDGQAFLIDCENFSVGFPLEYAALLRQQEDFRAVLRRNRDHFSKYFRYVKDELKENEFTLRLLRDLNDEYSLLFSVCMNTGEMWEGSCKDYKVAMERLAAATHVIASQEAHLADQDCKNQEISCLKKEKDDLILECRQLASTHGNIETETIALRQQLAKEESEKQCLSNVNYQLKDTVCSLEIKLEQAI